MNLVLEMVISESFVLICDLFNLIGYWELLDRYCVIFSGYSLVSFDKLW
jgi:hypothetical protein